jgi:CheY-like chemotaxis protein
LTVALQVINIPIFIGIFKSNKFYFCRIIFKYKTGIYFDSALHEDGAMKKSELHMNRVVLADDDPDHGFLFQLVLSEVDPSKNLTIVKDGTELMELLDSYVPDLLFLDLNMPCKNGYECLVEIRQRSELQKLPIVVYSSSTHMTDIQKSYVHKADLYMVKPFNALHLRNALESILQMDWIKNSPSQKFYFINNRFVPFTA